MNYGKNIKLIRDSKGIKAQWVASRLGVSISTYSEIELGKRKLTVERAAKIADILGVPISDILCPQVSETLSNQTPTGTDC